MENPNAFMQKLADDVSYLRGKLDATLPQIEKAFSDSSRMIHDHEKRLDDAETFQNTVKTKVGIYGGFAGFLFGVLSQWIGKHYL